jgi:hypothetical protein
MLVTLCDRQADVYTIVDLPGEPVKPCLLPLAAFSRVSLNPGFFYRCTRDSNVRSRFKILADDFCMPFPSRCIRKLAGLPDDLVCQEEQGWGHGDAEGLGGLQVDD